MSRNIRRKPPSTLNFINQTYIWLSKSLMAAWSWINHFTRTRHLISNIRHTPPYRGRQYRHTQRWLGMLW